MGRNQLNAPAYRDPLRNYQVDKLNDLSLHVMFLKEAKKNAILLKLSDLVSE